MDRFRTALLLPLSALPVAVAIALFIGWSLHQVPRDVAPLVALMLTLGITAAAFIADRAAD